MAKPVGTLGTIDTIVISGSAGSRTITDISGVIATMGCVNGANRYSTMNLPSGTSGYAPSGNTYVIEALDVYVVGAGNLSIGYCDANIGLQTNTAPTNPVYMANITPAISRGNVFDDIGGTGIQAGLSYGFIIPEFVVPNGKFLFIDNVNGNGTLIVTAYGKNV